MHEYTGRKFNRDIWKASLPYVEYGLIFFADGFRTEDRCVQVLDICLRMNVHCVSAYAFAIDNFNRPKEEVDALMNLAQSKLLELCNEGYLLNYAIERALIFVT